MALVPAAGCSSFPADEVAGRREVVARVVYEFGEAGPHPVLLPQSTSDLKVLELRLRDGEVLHEAFADGGRWLLPPAGTERVELEVRYLAYPHRDASGRLAPPPSPQELFPEASLIDLLRLD